MIGISQSDPGQEVEEDDWEEAKEVEIYQIYNVINSNATQRKNNLQTDLFSNETSGSHMLLGKILNSLTLCHSEGFHFRVASAQSYHNQS